MERVWCEFPKPKIMFLIVLLHLTNTEKHLQIWQRKASIDHRVWEALINKCLTKTINHLKRKTANDQFTVRPSTNWLTRTKWLNVAVDWFFLNYTELLRSSGCVHMSPGKFWIKGLNQPNTHPCTCRSWSLFPGGCCSPRCPPPPQPPPPPPPQ